MIQSGNVIFVVSRGINAGLITFDLTQQQSLFSNRTGVKINLPFSIYKLNTRMYIYFKPNDYL